MTCAIVIFDACYCPNIDYFLFYTLHRNGVGADGAESKICCIVIDVLWLVLYIVWGTAIIFTISLSCKGGGIAMACSSLTKSILTWEQSLSIPLCVACLKLGWMKKFSARSLYCPLFAQRWRLSCAKAFTLSKWINRSSTGSQWCMIIWRCPNFSCSRAEVKIEYVSPWSATRAGVYKYISKNKRIFEHERNGCTSRTRYSGLNT